MRISMLKSLLILLLSLPTLAMAAPAFGMLDFSGYWQQFVTLNPEKPNEKLITKSFMTFENRSHYREFFYSLNDLQKPYFTFRTESIFYTSFVREFPTDNGTVSNGFVDYSIQNVYMNLNNQALVSEYNRIQTCGLSNWKLGVDQNITGLECHIFEGGRAFKAAKRNQMAYGIFKIESDCQSVLSVPGTRDLNCNEKLFFGQANAEKNGSTPEKRPTDWIVNPLINSTVSTQ